MNSEPQINRGSASKLTAEERFERAKCDVLRRIRLRGKKVHHWPRERPK